MRRTTTSGPLAPGPGLPRPSGEAVESAVLGGRHDGRRGALVLRLRLRVLVGPLLLERLPGLLRHGLARGLVRHEVLPREAWMASTPRQYAGSGAVNGNADRPAERLPARHVRAFVLRRFNG